MVPLRAKGKILKLDPVSQNSFGVLWVTSRGNPWMNFTSYWAPYNSHVPKSVLWFQSYFIYSTKSILKPRGVDLGVYGQKTLWEFLYLSFAVTRLKIGPIEKMQKMALKLHKTAYPALGYPRKGIPNIFKSICYQNLTNAIYRRKLVHLVITKT